MEARRGLAVRVEVEDHLRALPRRSTRRRAVVEGIEPRLRDAQQCVGPGHVPVVTPVALAVVGVPQLEFAVAAQLQRLLHECPFIGGQADRTPPHAVIAVGEPHSPPGRSGAGIVVWRLIVGRWVGVGMGQAGEHPDKLRHRQRRRQLGHLQVVIGVGVANDHRCLVFAQRSRLEQRANVGQSIERARGSHEPPGTGGRHTAAPHHPVLGRANAEALPRPGAQRLTDQRHQLGGDHVQQAHGLGQPLFQRSDVIRAVRGCVGQRHVTTLYEHTYVCKSAVAKLVRANRSDPEPGA
jgi:hypothetical protein